MTRPLPFPDLAGLAAARAALDPARSDWRSDILLSSVIELLASKGPLAERELLQNVRELWVSTAVNRATLRTALDTAEKAHLIERRQQGKNEARWAATESTAADAKLDREWAVRRIEKFQVDVGHRLEEILNAPVEPARLPRLTRTLIGALIAGSSQVFSGIASSGGGSFTGHMYYDQARADEHISERTHPRGVAEALCAIAVLALDPGDEFGTELMQLIVSGQVLHGLLTRRDLGGSHPLGRGTMLVLDTSALLYKLDVSPMAQAHLLHDLLVEASEAGARLVVTRAVLREWQRVWDAADGEHSTLTVARTAPPPFAVRLLNNVVIRAWAQADEHGDGPSWSQFSAHHRDIEHWLTARGVSIVENDEVPNLLMQAYCDEIERLARSAQRPLRSRLSAQTDAFSAALIRAARAEQPQCRFPSAWFVAQERLSGHAHENLDPSDRFPLTLSVETVVLLLSAMRVDEPEKRRELAGIVGNSLIMNSFFALSTGYGAEDINAIVELLATDAHDVEGLSESIRSDLLTLASHTTDPPAELLRRRSARRDRQSLRRASELDTRSASVEEQVSAANLRISAAEERAAAAERARDAADARVRARGRFAALVGICAVLIVVLILCLSAGLHLLFACVGFALVAAVICEGIAWCRDLKVKTPVFLASVGATVAWTAVSALIAVVTSQPQGGPTKTPRPTPSAISHTG